MVISYHLSWQKPNSHFFNLEMTVQNPGSDATEFRIPAWRPGRYIIQNYSKNIINFEAVDHTGRTLAFQKLDKDTWKVNHGGVKEITVRYQNYAYVLDAGASYLDDSEAYINPITLLMYIPGQEMLPVSMRIKKPDDWKIATALDADPVSGAFLAANYHELVDSPFLISPDFELLSFEHDGAIIELALQGAANYNRETVLEDIRKIVADQCKMMGGPPFKRYLFMVHLMPYRIGHGVEHKNSTSIVTGPADFDDPVFYGRFLGVSSHEFFHVWNVERIRPESIYLPDYSKERYTSHMWFYEGVTSYYDLLSLKRSGVFTKYQFYAGLERSINRLQRTHGRKVTSAAMASWNSWATFEDPPPHTTISFYNKGEILGLMLDMEIRQRTNNQKSLDDVMRYLYDNYALMNKGVPETGIQSAVEYVVSQEIGQRSSFAAFFADYVYGTREIEYNAFLKTAGLELSEITDPEALPVYLGLDLRGDDKETTIRRVAPESPAFEAGLDQKDVLMTLDGQRFHKENQDLILRQYNPGDKVSITVIRREKLRHFEVTLGEPHNTEYIIQEISSPASLQVSTRNSWLNDGTELNTK